MLDGEIVALDGDGRPSFQRLQARIHLTTSAEVARAARAQPVIYMIFDLLYLDGESPLDADHATRRRRLEELQLEGDAWRVPPTLDGAAEDVLAASRAAGLEGIVAKRRDSPYKPGYRGREWLKIKNVLRQEFVVGGYTAGSGRRADSIGALLVGYHRATASCTTRARWAPATPTPIWRCSPNGFDRSLANARRSRSERRPRTRRSSSRELVCECSFAEWTRQGRLRQPSFVGLREDKPAADVVREEASE